MSEISQDVSEPALITAIEANLFALFPWLRQWPQAEVHDDPNMLWTITNIPFPLFNSILRAKIALEDIDAIIEPAITRGRSRNVPMLWWTGPTTRPDNLGIFLEAHGFVHEGDLPGMAADLLLLNDNLRTAPSFIVKRVADAKTLKDWCGTVVVGFEMPDFVAGAMQDLFASIGLAPRLPLRHYIGYLDGKSVATSSVFLGAGVAGIYNVATLPEARRKGIGTAMTLTPLLQARAEGYRVGILHSSPIGFNVYSQVGFREYCKIGHYIWASEHAK